jgi:hypothetical protein
VKYEIHAHHPLLIYNYNYVFKRRMQAPGIHDDERYTHHLQGEEPRSEAAEVKNAQQVGREQ